VSANHETQTALTKNDQIQASHMISRALDGCPRQHVMTLVDGTSS
jgi:hypothetical protein